MTLEAPRWMTRQWGLHRPSECLQNQFNLLLSNVNSMRQYIYLLHDGVRRVSQGRHGTTRTDDDLTKDFL
jgi:hypothetical protein